MWLFLFLIMVFIWGNSILPSATSNMISNHVTRVIDSQIFKITQQMGFAPTWLTTGHVRKLAHATEFCMLGIFVSLLIVAYGKKVRNNIPQLLLIGLSMAVVDETIQLFNDRTSQLRDVWIDMSGFILGILIVSLAGRFILTEKRAASMKAKKQKLLISLIVLTLCFIWGNSLMPASISSMFSGWARDAINGFLGDFGSNGGLSGDGVLRKVAHASEFALLGIELMGLRTILKNRLTTTFFFGLVVAVIDETIQLFSQGRSSQIKDVWIDFGGFTVGVLIIGIIIRILKKRQTI